MQRSGSLTGTSTVHWAVSGLVDAADFAPGTALSGNLTFAPTETTKTITLTVQGDTVVEPDETYMVSLSNPVGATIAVGSATGTIRNDDSPAFDQSTNTWVVGTIFRLAHPGTSTTHAAKGGGDIEILGTVDGRDETWLRLWYNDSSSGAPAQRTFTFDWNNDNKTPSAPTTLQNWQITLNNGEGVLINIGEMDHGGQVFKLHSDAGTSGGIYTLPGNVSSNVDVAYQLAWAYANYCNNCRPTVVNDYIGEQVDVERSVGISRAARTGIHIDIPGRDHYNNLIVRVTYNESEDDAGDDEAEDHEHDGASGDHEHDGASGDHEHDGASGDHEHDGASEGNDRHDKKSGDDGEDNSGDGNTRKFSIRRPVLSGPYQYRELVLTDGYQAFINYGPMTGLSGQYFILYDGSTWAELGRVAIP